MLPFSCSGKGGLPSSKFAGALVEKPCLPKNKIREDGTYRSNGTALTA